MLQLLLEPGETYFLLKDFSTDQTLIMGRDARLQNEVLANGKVVYFPEARNHVRQFGEMEYLAKCDSVLQCEMERIDSLFATTTPPSERYRIYHRNIILTDLGHDMILARFFAPDRNLSDEYIKYVTENIFNKLDAPYSVGQLFQYFFNRYCQVLQDRYCADYNFLDVMQFAEDEGIGSFSEADKQSVRDFYKRLEIFYEQRESNKYTKEQGDSIAKAFNEDANTKRVREVGNSEIYSKALINLPLRRIKDFLNVTDSLGWTQLQRDIYLGQTLCETIDHERKPLPSQLFSFAKDYIRLPMIKAAVIGMNRRYESLAKMSSSTKSLCSSDNVKGLSDGGQILKKILEPLRGKIVLLDIWGTWCGPCKKALAKSQEEYERLKPYGIAYLYLANRSPTMHGATPSTNIILPATTLCTTTSRPSNSRRSRTSSA